MSSRAKPRGGPIIKENAEEELAMWQQVLGDLHKLAQKQNRTIELGKLITACEERFAAKTPSSEDISSLENYYRELTRLAQEERQMLTEEPADVIRNVEILAALRRASESNVQRIVPQPSKIRKPKGPRVDMDSMDSPAPSPGLASSARFKGSTARSGSAPSSRDGRDPIFNFEDSIDGAKGSSAERAGKFVVGAEVAYKQARPKEDGGQWIQCSITNVTEIANKKRYEVQDPEPDDGGPGAIYKTSAAALIAIPLPGAILPDYPVGKHVLARYPETTTFYRAEVTAMKKDVCRLKFEDDQNQEMEVDRRYVLDVSNK